MNTSTNYAAIFYSNTDNDLEVLQKNVDDFPASSVARFLLLYHHKKNNHPAFRELAKQTALFLNNPGWSEYQLWQIDNPSEIISEQKTNEEELPDTAKEEIIEIPSEETTPSFEENKETLSEKINDEEQLPASVKEEIIEVPSSEIESKKNENQPAEINKEQEFSTSGNEEISENSVSETTPRFQENNEPFFEKIINEEQLPASVKEEIIEVPSSGIESHNDEEPLEKIKAEQECATSENEEITENSVSETTPVFEETREALSDKINDEEQLPASANEEIIENSSSEFIPVLQEDGESYLEKTIPEEELPASVKEEIIEIPSRESAPVIVDNKEYSLEENKDEDQLLPSVKEEIIEIPSSELVTSDVGNKMTDLENSEPAKEAEIEPSAEEEKNIHSEDHDLSKEENQHEDKSVLEIKIPDESGDSFKENSNPDEDEYEAVTFEPLHTVDYFASQGIKINEEALANDHLVKQVKSFTAWLKSMKKLHPGQLPEQNEVIEKIIQASSESSNKDANVLTEAMAEVLIKQGKREKALEMYQKLSLINPSKSAYFAAKIENLKIV